MNTFDEIIQTKAYSELSSNELEIIQELVSSEEEYNEMKSFYAEIDQLAISNREEVSASVKTSLNTVFQAKHPGISQNWNAPAEVTEKKIVPLYNRTIFRVAAVLLLSASATTLWFSLPEEQLEKSHAAKITASTDSVSPETVNIEQKKKFPLNEETKKEFTAASAVPEDKNVSQDVSIYSNGTTSASYTLSDKASAPPVVAGAPYKVNRPDGSRVTSSSGRADDQSKSTGAEKADGKKDLNILTKAGLDADLNPGGFYASSAKDYKPSIQTSDYLMLIEPSF
ncbi:hypothetical protein [Fluviicola chungangensis]|uniref:Uncharacterized protein n=1 Tax=Fluviicola chungangensis TaxID=2597671 RepID=A0A556N7D3_9FLAO|nr:hypothetical protein [Fluviicola chungangensis]TSJ48086.1 hypothetical protein FO442_02835 [Fluviicola chungangensis]